MNNNIIVFLMILSMLFFCISAEKVNNKKTGIKPIERFTRSNKKIINEEENYDEESDKKKSDCSAQIILIDSLWENAKNMLLNTNDSIFSNPQKNFLKKNKNLDLINLKMKFSKNFKCK